MGLLASKFDGLPFLFEPRNVQLTEPMKTPIAARIEQHLNRSGEERLTQKELAVRLHERSSKVKPSTIEEKLSKLMNGNEEGERFFNLESLKALAEELNEPLERLQQLLRIPTLVLHPELPEPAKLYLLERAAACYGTADWIIPISLDPANSSPEEPLATVARIQQATAGLNRSVLVIVSTESLSCQSERSLYDVAKLPFATVERSPRGYVIVDHADILPLPAPPPAKLVDDDGERLYPVAEMAAQAYAAWHTRVSQERYGSNSDWRKFEGILNNVDPNAARLWGDRLPVKKSYVESPVPLLERLSPILSGEGIPTFRGSEILGWLTSQLAGKTPVSIAPTPPDFVQLLVTEIGQLWSLIAPGWRPEGAPAPDRRPANKIIADEIEQGSVGKTTIWHHSGRWFIFGTDANKVRERLQTHCPELELRLPTFPSHLAQLLRDNRNPWTAAPRWFDAFAQNTLDECGVTTLDVLNLWRNASTLSEMERYYRYRFEATNAAHTKRARDALESLLSREFELSETQMWPVFVLRQALQAQLLAVHFKAEPAAWNAIINLGAGHLIRLRVAHYPLDPESCIRVITDEDFAKFWLNSQRTETHLDGGNVHIQIAELPTVWLLEGSVARATRRAQARSEEREREAREQSYGDDDE